MYPRAAWIAFAWSMLVAFSVIYLGEHWGIDVLAGWVFAALCWGALMHFVVPHVAALREPQPVRRVGERSRATA